MQDYLNQFTENMKKYATDAMNSASELQKITAETFDRHTRKNIDALNAAVENATRNMQALSGIRQFDELTSFYQDLSKEANANTIAYTRQVLEDALSTARQYTDAIEKSIEALNKADK